jgi:2-oxoglutarate ferredoxin oxidoreductase subunit gamma
MDRHELVVGGTGGQGVITIAYALAAAASQTYQFVSRFPIYMATQRGGPAFATVIFSNNEIAAPILSRAMNTIAMETGSFSRLKKETLATGRLFVNSSIVKKIDPTLDYSIFPVPVTDMAQEMGAPQMANIIMLGAYRTVTGVLSDEAVLAAVAKETGEGRFQLSKKAYETGAEFARAQKWI